MGMGEMAGIVLGGNRVSAQKILATGFQFQFPTIENALKNLLKN
jgi:NAD dependent epimerase/dehydratase family enzyme